MSDEPARQTTLGRRLRALPANVVALGVVSLVADFSTEMIYPVFPGFVTKTLGASAAALDLIEGTADATASVTRYPFGRLSDAHGRRRFVLGGYGLATLGKLVLALAFVWPVALGGRFLDRLGKGMRTAPRDALLAAGVRDADRGLAFGLHRAMDTAGAVVGPLTTLLLLHLGLSLRWVFALAVVPGALSVVVVWRRVRERAPRAAAGSFAAAGAAAAGAALAGPVAPAEVDGDQFTWPVISPDGSMIATEQTGSDIGFGCTVYALDGTKRLTKGGLIWPARPAWTGQGQRLAFGGASATGGTEFDSLNTWTPGASAPAIVVTGLKRPVTGVAWTPKASQIAYAVSDATGLQSVLWIASAVGSNRHVLIVHGSSPAWAIAPIAFP